MDWNRSTPLGERMKLQRARTKTLKSLLAGLNLTITTNFLGSLVAGHSDELLRAKAKLVAAGYEIGITYDSEFWI